MLLMGNKVIILKGHIRKTELSEYQLIVQISIDALVKLTKMQLMKSLNSLFVGHVEPFKYKLKVLLWYEQIWNMLLHYSRC
jgi:hypothetical protein